jgi:hypothetical protein
MMTTLSGSSHNDDDAQQLHPLAYSIVWSPLPPITWILPFIGHMGITTSKGIACDFQGPYSVGDRGRMAFGRPTRALRMDVTSLSSSSSSSQKQAAEIWDGAIAVANSEYRTRMHNICCDNCHSHVAFALNHMELTYYGIRSWDMVKLCFLVFFKGRFLSVGGFIVQFLPWGVVMLLILLVKLL